MHPKLEALPSRVRRIVLEEVAAGAIWQAPEIITVDRVFRMTGRNLSVSRVRAAIWWRCRRELQANGKPVSFPQIGTWFGVDHSSVVHAVKRFPEYLSSWSVAKQEHYARQRAGTEPLWEAEPAQNAA